MCLDLIKINCTSLIPGATLSRARNCSVSRLELYRQETFQFA
jgi:hypothetical protein